MSPSSHHPNFFPYPSATSFISHSFQLYRSNRKEDVTVVSPPRAFSLTAERIPSFYAPGRYYICPLICTFKGDFFSVCQITTVPRSKRWFSSPLWDQAVRLFVTSSSCTNLSWLLASRTTKEPLSLQQYARMAICLTTQQLIQLYNSTAGLTEATYTVSFHAVRYKSFPWRRRNTQFL